MSGEMKTLGKLFTLLAFSPSWPPSCRWSMRLLLTEFWGLPASPMRSAGTRDRSCSKVKAQSSTASTMQRDDLQSDHDDQVLGILHFLLLVATVIVDVS